MPTREEMERSFSAWLEAVQAANGRAPTWAFNPTEYAFDPYTKSALQWEKEAAEQYVPTESLAARGRGTLLLGVGSTYAPVLLSIALHQPACLVLAGSESSEGRTYLQRVGEVLDNVPGAPARGNRRTVEYPAHDPTRAFLALRRAVADKPRPLLVDITGGTKGMAAAAFFLAVELGARAVYLHGDYVPELHIPRPTTTRVYALPDPAVALALHDLKRVDALWRESSFGSVASLLGEVVTRLESGGMDEAQLDPYRKAHDAALACAAWSEARYDQVPPAMRKAGCQVPDAIRPLCDRWPDLMANDPGGLDRRLALDPGLHVRYLADAWRWLDRQTAADPRLRFLRYFAIGEAAMDGLLIALRSQDPSRIADPWPPEDNLEWPRSAVRESIADPNKPWSGLVAAWLLGGSKKTLREKKLENVIPGWAPLDEAKPWYKPNDGHDWRDAIRNKCAHAVGNVPEGQLDAIRNKSRELLLACAGRLPESVGVTRDHVETWLTDEAAEPPSLPDFLP